jgi:hypothetical protein
MLVITSLQFIQKREKELAEEYKRTHPEAAAKPAAAAAAPKAAAPKVTPEQKALVDILDENGVEVPADSALVKALLKWKTTKF